MAGLSQLGEYLLLEQIGQGGMGVVYKAQHRLLKRLVAVKLLPGSLDSDSAALTRFLREIEALGRLDHRHLVRAFDAGNDQGRLFLVLEHLQGQTLGQYLKQHGKASVTDACTWTIQAALGLQHAHEHGLVHRDIKPANLFRAAQSGKPPVIKILDLGLVQWQVQAASQQLTATGQTLGTPEYMSPEQIEHGTALDIRTDIYSLGCTLFHLLAGQPPFPGGTYHQVLAGHLLNPPPSLRELRSDVSTELEIIIGKMLAKKPAERYTTPSEVASVLQAFLQADRVPCPNCGKWLRVPGHAQGKRIACPVCKTLVTPSVTLEQPASSSKPEAPPAVNSSALPEAQPVFPSEIRLPRPPEPPTLLERTGYRLWIVAGVITLVAGITLVIGLGWWFSQPRSAPTSTLGSNVPWQSVELASPPNMDRFPEVALRVHLPSSMQGTLKVLEDGQEVWQGPLIPSKSLDELSLVLDTSGSMANSNKMTEAKRAILNLFDRLSPQTQCGLVLFHHQIHTKLALRKEREALREQIRMAEPAGGTAYQDAVWEALKLFPKNDADKHRSILLLTDGRDINSR
jgi:serine/threonine protein kinase